MINDNFLNETRELMKSIQEIDKPIVLAVDLGVYISRCLRNEWISLYEAYILNGEFISLTRGSGKCGWNQRVYISTCLLVLNQRMLAILYGDMEYAERLKEFGFEAMRLNDEKRPHFIIDN